MIPQLYQADMLLLAILTLTAPVAAAPEADLFVSPEGRDSWSGRLSAPNAARTDGPLATPEAARQKVQDMPKGGKSITVMLRGGTYRVTGPLVLTPEDSGTPDDPVIYTAYPGEKPIIDGGRRIMGFKKEGHLWKVTIPEVKAGDWRFMQLFVDGKRRPRARIPNQGFLRMAGTPPAEQDAEGRDIPRNKSAFVFRPGDIRRWDRLEDAALILIHSWENSIHHIKSIDTEKRIVELAAPVKEWWTIGYWERPQRYFIENVYEGLDSPGEWYLDRATGVLSYYPLPGEEPEKAEVVAPVTSELLRFEGRPDQGEFVQDIRLSGITFRHSDWTLAPEGNSSTQAAVEVPASITGNGAIRCSLEGCTVAHTGTYGISLARGCKDCRIVRCHLYDLGAGGIRLGEPKMPESDSAETSRTLADNNYIHDYGEVYPAGVGILLLQTSDNRVSHNEIHDGNYTGISVGWNWSRTPTRSHRNVIEYNHIHHVVRRLLSDGAGIYTLGTSPGTVLRGNIIHDVFSYEQPMLAWGIYLDAETNQMLVEDNLCYNIQNGGLMFHNGAFENTVRNNIFAFCALETVWRAQPVGGPNTFERNICYVTRGNLFLQDGNPDLKSVWDHNLYWRTDNQELLFNGLPLSDWQAKGLDRNSLVADPEFRNATRRDFRLKATSPAILKLGFRPLDLEKCGLYGDPAWAGLPRKRKFPRTVFPPLPSAAKPAPISQDFEAAEAGEPPQNAVCILGEVDGASIAVSDKQVASGKHSLEVRDAPGLRNNWDPHFFYQPHFAKGTARLRLKLWAGPGAMPWIEWRDGSAPYATGPSLSIDANGWLLAAGKTLIQVPREEWMELEIRCALGQQATGTYDLKVTLPGQPAKEFRALPCDPEFSRLEWLGFISLATEKTVFYVDDIRLEGGR